MNTHTLLSKLNQGESVFGVFSPYAHSNLSELLSAAGFDFVILDGEHGNISHQDVAANALACEKQKSTCLYRTPNLLTRTIGLALDNGAHGVLAPMINTHEQAKSLSEASNYPPLGKRGLALTRSLEFGLKGDLSTLIKEQIGSTITAIQVETQESINNLDEILKVDEINLVFVGPADLSIDLGCSMDFQHPKFLSGISSIAAKVNASPKHLGVLVTSEEQVEPLQQLGFRLFALYIDQLLSTASTTFLNKVKT